MKFRGLHDDGDGPGVQIDMGMPMWFVRPIFGKRKLEELRRRAHTAPDATLEIQLPFGLGVYGCRWPRDQA